MITRLVDSVHLLHMHALVLETARKEFWKIVWSTRAQTGGAALIGAAAAAATVQAGLPIEATAGFGCTALVGAGMSHWYGSKVLEAEQRRLVSADGLNRLFEDLFASQVRQRLSSRVAPCIEDLSFTAVVTLRATWRFSRLLRAMPSSRRCGSAFATASS